MRPNRRTLVETRSLSLHAYDEEDLLRQLYALEADEWRLARLVQTQPQWWKAYLERKC